MVVPHYVCFFTATIDTLCSNETQENVNFTYIID